MNRLEYNALTQQIIRCAIETHTQLGPGLMESVYEICLYKELIRNGLKVERQVALPVIYKEEVLNKEYFIDLLIEDEIIVELKSVETIHPLHEAQLVSYLRLSGKKLGLLINFNVVRLKEGVKRKINGNLESQ